MIKRWTLVSILGLLMMGSLASFASQECGTALLVIDVQSNLLAMGGSRLQTLFGEPILDSVEPIVEAARSAGLPIIYSKYVTGAMVETPELVRIPDAIAPRDADFVVVRPGVDPLDETLLILLEEEGISQLIVVGLYSSCCVDNAVCAADDLGYEVIVLEEGHGDFAGNRALAVESQASWKELEYVTVERFDNVNFASFCNP